MINFKNNKNLLTFNLENLKNLIGIDSSWLFGKITTTFFQMVKGFLCSIKILSAYPAEVLPANAMDFVAPTIFLN